MTIHPSRLIGICGPIGSGKTTLATLLKSQHDYTRVRFAGPLKAMLAQLLALQGVRTAQIKDMLDGSLKETPTIYLNNQTPRFVMQTLGTEWGRDLIHPNLWVDVWEREVKAKFAAQSRRVVCDDVRFRNEAQKIKAMGGTLVGLVRPGLHSALTHMSEKELIDINPDFEVINIDAEVRGNRDTETLLLERFKSSWFDSYGEQF